MAVGGGAASVGGAASLWGGASASAPLQQQQQQQHQGPQSMEGFLRWFCAVPQKKRIDNPSKGCFSVNAAFVPRFLWPLDERGEPYTCEEALARAVGLKFTPRKQLESGKVKKASWMYLPANGRAAAAQRGLGGGGGALHATGGATWEEGDSE